MAVHFCPTCRSAFESPEPRCVKCGQVIGEEQQWTPPWAMETSMDMEAPSTPTADEPQTPRPPPMAAHDQKTLLEGHAPATPQSGPDQATLLEARASKLMAQVDADHASSPASRAEAGAENATLLDGRAPDIPASPPAQVPASPPAQVSVSPPQQPAAHPGGGPGPHVTELVRPPTSGGRWVVVAGLVAAALGLSLLVWTLLS